jgi:hypothetical protein
MVDLPSTATRPYGGLPNGRATYLLHHDEITLDRTATGQYKNVGELSNRLENVAARLAFCAMTFILCRE